MNFNEKEGGEIVSQTFWPALKQSFALSTQKE